MIILDKKDKQILSILKKGPYYPSLISKKTGIVRTTVNYRLCKLHTYKYVDRHTQGKKVIWQIVPGNIFGKEHFRLYKENEIVNGYNELLRLPKNTVILSIQGYNAARNELRHLPHYFIKEAHRVFKRKNIVIRGIVNKKSLECFKDLQGAMIQSHTGRGMGLTLLEGDILLGSGECMATNDMLLLANPEKRTVLIVKDRDITEIFYQILNIHQSPVLPDR